MIPKTIQDRHTARRSFLLRLFASLHVPFDDREDLAHQSLLRFLRSGYGEMELNQKNENALLARIGYSAFIDVCRKRRCLSLGIREADIVDESTHHRQQQIIVEIRDLIARADLSDDELALIESKFGDGKSLVTISKETGLHVNTIRRRLAKGLDRIKRQARRQDLSNPLGEV